MMALNFFADCEGEGEGVRKKTLFYPLSLHAHTLCILSRCRKTPTHETRRERDKERKGKREKGKREKGEKKLFSTLFSIHAPPHHTPLSLSIHPQYTKQCLETKRERERDKKKNNATNLVLLFFRCHGHVNKGGWHRGRGGTCNQNRGGTSSENRDGSRGGSRDMNKWYVVVLFEKRDDDALVSGGW